MTSATEAPDTRARRWAKLTVSLRTSQLRVAWLREELRKLPVAEAAEALEQICSAADAADARSEAFVHALVELLAEPAMREARDALRLEARSKKFLTLERLLRRPFVAIARPTLDHPTLQLDDEIALTNDNAEPRAKDVPDYGRGRTLTLGERKSLARRPPPHLLPKVLSDPHPDVIRNVLASARLTEDDVVRLATKRPGKAEVLQEVARHPRWCQRPRVRMALVMNPSTPSELAISMVALLRRNELKSVAEATALHPAIRSAATERLARRPPMPPGTDGTVQ